MTDQAIARDLAAALLEAAADTGNTVNGDVVATTLAVLPEPEEWAPVPKTEASLAQLVMVAADMVYAVTIDTAAEMPMLLIRSVRLADIHSVTLEQRWRQNEFGRAVADDTWTFIGPDSIVLTDITRFTPEGQPPATSTFARKLATRCGWADRS